MTIFTTTDIDGDTITIARNEGILTATITGEDGHRTVILTDADIDRLKAALDT
jgi:hypothetical protein